MVRSASIETDGECLRALTNGDSISALKCGAGVTGSLKQPQDIQHDEMHACFMGCEIQKKSKLITNDHWD